MANGRETAAKTNPTPDKLPQAARNVLGVRMDVETEILPTHTPELFSKQSGGRRTLLPAAKWWRCRLNGYGWPPTRRMPLRVGQRSSK